MQGINSGTNCLIFYLFSDEIVACAKITQPSRVEPDWLNSFSFISRAGKPDSILGVSVAGIVKVWRLVDLDQKVQFQFFTYLLKHAKCKYSENAVRQLFFLV